MHTCLLQTEKLGPMNCLTGLPLSNAAPPSHRFRMQVVRSEKPMRQRKLQFRIREFSIAIAFAAIVMAIDPSHLPVACKLLLGVVGAVVTLVSKYTKAPWFKVATWFAWRISYIPPTGICTTWAVAYLELGRLPLASSDDPGTISPLVNIPHRLTWTVLILGVRWL